MTLNNVLAITTAALSIIVSSFEVVDVVLSIIVKLVPIFSAFIYFLVSLDKITANLQQFFKRKDKHHGQDSEKL